MDTSIETRLAEVEAQLAIQNLVSRYARTVDSRNLDELGTLFSARTRFGDDGTGPEGARAFYGTVLSTFYRSFHQIAGQVIEIDGPDSAHGTVYCRAEHEDGDHWVVNLLVYFDRYVREDGRWCFLGRRPRFLYVGDVTQSPRAGNFSHWPGREAAYGMAAALSCDLPQSDDSWAEYWTARPEERAKVTSLP